jgi:threonine synthase
MKFNSSRGQTKGKNFSDIIIAGTADDGGLYLPENLPFLEVAKLKDLSYIDLATEITSIFATDIEKNVIKNCYENAYSIFKNGILPIEKLKDNLYLIKLFQGPTLSFKDYALRFLGNVVDYVLKQKKIQKQIITATSGDTGPAALYGFKDCKNVKIKVYFPDKNVSKMQREQMTSLKQSNIEVVPLDGSFDDCQKIVKDAFANDKSGNLMTVNSINIGRIVSQIVYYVYIYLQLDQRPINFFVPTGNFGNICAGYMAKTLLNDKNVKLSICVNENDTLYRFYNTGIYEPKPVVPTPANAIDIAHPSNFERILYYLSEEKEDVNKYIDAYKINQKYEVDPLFLKNFKNTFNVYKVITSEIYKTQENAKDVFAQNICPHTAVALKSAIDNPKDNVNNVVFATASPTKFEN